MVPGYPSALSAASRPQAGLRGLVRRLLTHPLVLRGASALSGGHATICFLHRFSEAEDSSGAFPVPVLRSHLQWLRSHRYRLVSLGTLLDELHEGKPILPRTVVFTIDDGYADFHQLASPVFEEFDCPATVFLVTGFIDDRAWLWWNRIEYGFAHTLLKEWRLEAAGAALDHGRSDAHQRQIAAETVTERLKWLPAGQRDAAIKALLTNLEVDIPSRATSEFAPMTWAEIRELNEGIFSFGPHTVTHPVLSLESDASARAEIAGSWSRVQAEVPGAVQAFCFPNGDPLSFGSRELGILSEIGPLASVSTSQRSVSARIGFPKAERLMAPLPRFQLESDFARFVQVVSGVDRLKEFLRWNR